MKKYPIITISIAIISARRSLCIVIKTKITTLFSPTRAQNREYSWLTLRDMVADSISDCITMSERQVKEKNCNLNMSFSNFFQACRLLYGRLLMAEEDTELLGFVRTSVNHHEMSQVLVVSTLHNQSLHHPCEFWVHKSTLVSVTSESDMIMIMIIINMYQLSCMWCHTHWTDATRSGDYLVHAVELVVALVWWAFILMLVCLT